MSRIASLVASASDIEHEDVEVPKWGVTIRLQSMDLASRGDYLEQMIKAREEQDSIAFAETQAKIVVASAFDPEDGSPVFNEGDIPMLMHKHGGVVAMLAAKANRLSGLDADAEERLGKGSSASGVTPSDDQSLSLPES